MIALRRKLRRFNWRRWMVELQHFAEAMETDEFDLLTRRVRAQEVQIADLLLKKE